jgi:hypothetical protein
MGTRADVVGVDDAVSRAILIGVVTGSVLLVVGLAFIGAYAVRQRKRARKLVTLSDPFGTALYLVDKIPYSIQTASG